MSRRVKWTNAIGLALTLVVPVLPALVLWLWSGVVGG
jgi:hypothetical protein